MASVLRGCNIEGGEVIPKIFPGWRFPWLSFNNIREKVEFRQVEPKGVGGEEVEELLFLSKSLKSATGVCVWWGAFHPVW